MQLYILALASL